MGRRKQSDSLVEPLVASEDKKDGDEETKEFLLEGRRKSGNAWHDCDVSIRFNGPHHMLGVVFHGEEYDPNENIKDEIELLSRLRPRSELKEIENGQCSQVQVGDIVLACKMAANELWQYFNARVVKVHKKRHSAKTRCKCGFEISWMDSAEMKVGTEILQADLIRLMTKDADLRQHPVISKWLNLSSTNRLLCEPVPSSSLGSQNEKAKEAEENVSGLKPADGLTASRSSRGRKAVTGSKSNKLSDDDDNKAEEVGVPLKKPLRARGRKGIIQTPTLDQSALRMSQIPKLLPFPPLNLSESSLKMTIVASLDKDIKAVELLPLKKEPSRKSNKLSDDDDNKAEEVGVPLKKPPRARGRKGIIQTPTLDQSALQMSQTPKLLPVPPLNLSESSLKMTIVASLDKDTEAVELLPLKKEPSRKRGPKVATNETKAGQMPNPEPVMKAQKTQEEEQEEDGQASDQKKEPARRRGLMVARNGSNKSQTPKPEIVLKAGKTQEEDGQACDQKKEPSRRRGLKLARNESNVSETPKPEPVMKAHKTQEEDKEEDGQACGQKKEPTRRRGPKMARNESNASQTPKPEPVMKAQKTQEEDQEEDGQAYDQKKEPSRRRGPKVARNESNTSQMPKLDTVLKAQKTQEVREKDGHACDQKKEPSKRGRAKVVKNESNTSQMPTLDESAVRTSQTPKLLPLTSNFSESSLKTTIVDFVDKDLEIIVLPPLKKEPSRRRGPKAVINESKVNQMPNPEPEPVMKAQKTQEGGQEEDRQACDQKKQPSRRRGPKVARKESNAIQTPKPEPQPNESKVSQMPKPEPEPVMKAQKTQEGGQEEDGQACDQKKQSSRRRGPKVARKESNASQVPKPEPQPNESKVSQMPKPESEPVIKAQKNQEGGQEEDGQACDQKKQPSRRRGPKVARKESYASQTPKPEPEPEPVIRARKTQEEGQEEDGQACDQENIFRGDELAPLLLQSTRGMEILGTINGVDSANNNRAIKYSGREFPNHVHNTCANEATEVVPLKGNSQTRNSVSQKRPREEEEELRLSSTAKKAKQHSRTSFIAFDELPVGFGLGISGWPTSLGITEAGNNVDPSAEMETQKDCNNGEKGIGSAIEVVVVGEEETEVKIMNSVIKAVSDVEDRKCKEGKTEARMRSGRGKRKDPPSQITTSTSPKPITESKRGRKTARLHVK